MIYFHIFALALMMVTHTETAQARKPAVEDFVGIEVDHPEATPQGTEMLFNFEKDIEKFEIEKKSAVPEATLSESQDATSFKTFFTVLFVLGLPTMIWLLMMHNLRQKAYAQSASNLEVLEKYRRDREEARKAQEDYKKAS